VPRNPAADPKKNPWFRVQPTASIVNYYKRNDINRADVRQHPMDEIGRLSNVKSTEHILALGKTSFELKEKNGQNMNMELIICNFPSGHTHPELLSLSKSKPLPASFHQPDSLDEVISKGDPKKRYQIIDEIGEGSFGVVFSAWDLQTANKVAIKKSMKLEESYEEEKKGPNPLDQLPPSKFSLENWKRTYSNSDEAAAIKFFWENIDLEGFSIWLCKYKYNDENKKVFMSCNLIGGFFNRLESARKYAFGSFGVFGKDDDNEIHGVWVFRGHEIPFEVRDCPDFESYDFTRLDTNLTEDVKKNINAFFAWKELDGLAKFSSVSKPFAEGKNFK